MAAFGWRGFSIGSAIVGVAVIVGIVLNDTDDLCADVERLVSESATDFDAVRGESIDPAGGEWAATYALDGASSCSIVVDPERVLYLCTWEHSISSGNGLARYEKEVERVRSCLDGAAERVDTSVNHPDFWASTRFAIPGGEVSVSLKNKSALGKVLVTIGADSSLTS